MSDADLLREAAAKMRADWPRRRCDLPPCACEGGFYRSVADWLVSTADDMERVHVAIYSLNSITVASALTVARTYLGRDA